MALAQHYGPPPIHTAGPPVHVGAQVIHGGPARRAPGGPPRGPTGSPPGFHGGGPVGRPRFAVGPIGRLGPRDQSPPGAAATGGNGWRSGRLGWWWFVGGFWYWYNAPVYPYPVYVADYYLAGELPAQGGPMWYYCYNPAGYYPYVRSCAGPWRAVPATPPPPP